VLIMLRSGWRRRRLGTLGRLWVALVAAMLIMAAGTAGSVVLHRWWNHAVQMQNAERLDRSVTSRVGRITDNLTRYLDALRAVGALVRTGSGAAHVGGEQFGSFVQGLHTGQRYIGLQAVGWQVPVAGTRAADLVAQIRADGQRNFTISPPGLREQYAPLVYQYGVEAVASRPGQDRRADAVVSAALDRARDSGEPSLVRSPAAGDRLAGVYQLFLPVYRGTPAAPERTRRAALLGWVSGQIHADRFLTEALSGIAADTAGVDLVDGDDPRPIAAQPDGFRPVGLYARTAYVAVPGPVWRLHLAPLPHSILIQSAEPAATIGLLGGLALSLLLAAMTVTLTAQAKTTRALRTANLRSADMVAMLSHDARQPLSTIINYSQLVLDDWRQATTISPDHAHPPAPDDTQAAQGTPATAATPGFHLLDDADIPGSLGRVIGAAHRLNHLVDDVLTTARLDAIPTRNARPVRVDEIIAEAVSDSGAHGMLIDTTAVHPAWACADPTHLRQITANLIGNALKYGAPPVTIAATCPGNEVIIEVSDGGPGVPAEFITHLFDRFTRAATTATNTHGSGLGLYIVQRLAEANGGHVTYQTRHPTGACFTLTLPAASSVTDDTTTDTPHRTR
jgi:signal transduction histidine kinase